MTPVYNTRNALGDTLVLEFPSLVITAGSWAAFFDQLSMCPWKLRLESMQMPSIVVCWMACEQCLQRAGHCSGGLQAGMWAEVRAGLKQPGQASAEEGVAWSGPHAMQGSPGQSRPVHAAIA